MSPCLYLCLYNLIESFGDECIASTRIGDGEVLIAKEGTDSNHLGMC